MVRRNWNDKKLKKKHSQFCNWKFLKIKSMKRSFRSICIGNEAEKNERKTSLPFFPMTADTTKNTFFCDKPGTPIKDTNVPTKWSWTDLPDFSPFFAWHSHAYRKIRLRFMIRQVSMYLPFEDFSTNSGNNISFVYYFTCQIYQKLLFFFPTEKDQSSV